MTTKSLLTHLKEEHKVFHKLDRIMLFIYPLFYIFGIWLFDRFVKHLNISKTFLLLAVEIFMLGMILAQARAIKRDAKLIESLIRKEIEPFLPEINLSFMTWGKYYPLSEKILLILLIVSPLIKLKYPTSFIPEYYKDVYFAVVIVYIFNVGFTKGNVNSFV